MGALRVRPLRRRLGLALLASALTHPVVWFAFPSLARKVGWTHGQMVVAAEIFAVAVEAGFLMIMGARRGLWASPLANACSVVAGLSLRRLGWPV